MPRIAWEEKHDFKLEQKIREYAHDMTRRIVGEEINRLAEDALDWQKDVVIVPSSLAGTATIEEEVSITIHGLRKPKRLEHTKEIGDAIWERLTG